MIKDENDRKGNQKDGGTVGGSITRSLLGCCKNSVTSILSEVEFHWCAMSRRVTCSNF